uniref:DNA polymerase n=10 Tax=Chelonid alphaherpesvirus 5 TaxID=702736 RepID=Q5Y970_9ALPH|nr:polymerase [Fibropapilloma-associated turtle herpesvirus]
MALFVNPFITGGGRRRGNFDKRPKFSYLVDQTTYRFVAPRSLLNPDQVGVRQGTAERQPRCKAHGRERKILEWDDAPWPQRVTRWGERDCRPETFESFFEEFHVYDALERTEEAELTRSGLSSRFAAHLYPSATVITLMGSTADGRRVAVHVYGSNAYFYIDKEEAEKRMEVSGAPELKKRLCALLQSSTRLTDQRNAVPEAFRVDTVDRQDIYYYDSRPRPFYRVHAKNHRHVQSLKDLLPVTVYEARVDPVTRFLIDNENFSSFGWYRLRTGHRARFRDPSAAATSADIELDCTSDDLEAVPEKQAWPPYKLLVFDIECKSGGLNEFAFPEADNSCDVVIQISTIVRCLKTGNEEGRLLFSLGSCRLPAETAGSATVIECDSEYELLLAFFTFFKQFSPEYLSGYNILGFDLPFLVNKAAAYDLKLDGYGRLERGGQFRVIDLSENRFQKNIKVRINGTVTLDVYPLLRGKLSLPNYKLDTVCREVLGETKRDVSYKEIPTLYGQGPEGRGLLGDYCLQDSALVCRLFEKFAPHVEMSEVAKLAHLPMNRIMTDGQQIRVFTCLLKAARKYGYILPDRRFGTKAQLTDPDRGPSLKGPEEGTEEENETENGAYTGDKGYQGATVLEPETGFYVDPVTVFDFASLYPSIIQAHNLCFTTLTRRTETLKELKAGEDYEEFKVQGMSLYYVKPHVRRSLLGELLTDWLALRKKIRASMKTAPSDQRLLLDKQQLAIKLTCNSVYGFTGVATGFLPCLEVAATVTTVGRDMLLATRDFIHTRWGTDFEALLVDAPELAAFRRPESLFGLRVIYGDTDSVFVLCTGVAAEGLALHGDALAAVISRALFSAPIKLECEKTFHKLLMITKKKYIGVIQGSNQMMMKGVDLVRKNNCRFVNRYSRDLVDCLFKNDEVSRAAAEIASRPPETWQACSFPTGFAPFGAILRRAHSELGHPDVSQFIQSAELSRAPAAYANAKLPHLTVYRKLLERREKPPQVRDRIEFVMIEPEARTHGIRRAASRPRPDPLESDEPETESDAMKSETEPAHKKPLISELAEDPAFVRHHNLPLNSDYYLTRLLSTAAVTFQALFGNNTRYAERYMKRFIPDSAPCGPRLKRLLDACPAVRVHSFTPENRGCEKRARICQKLCTFFDTH